MVQIFVWIFWGAGGISVCRRGCGWGLGHGWGLCQGRDADWGISQTGILGGNRPGSGSGI